jgi:hypothetical protein
VLPSTSLDLNVWVLVTCASGRGNRDDLPPSAQDAETKKLLWQTHFQSQRFASVGARCGDQTPVADFQSSEFSMSLSKNYRSNPLINSPKNQVCEFEFVVQDISKHVLPFDDNGDNGRSSCSL